MRIVPRMNVLLVQPLAPKTYWGFQYAVGMVGKGAPHPPLGLATLAALLPGDWDLRIADLNVAPLGEGDLRWADAALVTGMLVHKDAMHEVIERARRSGVRTVAGGPAVSSRPDEFADADHVFIGEAEGRLDALVTALESGSGPHVLSPPDDKKPDLASTLPPRFDLLDRSRYTSMSVQSSRGCPFQCEFCDIIELYGRNPRVKSPAQMLRELDALYELGWRGSIFVVDDNFIGNRRETAKLLPEIARWQSEHGRPFELYTEASVDLASLPALVESMVEAGFTTVFLGIETPSVESLKHTHKLQNLKLPLQESVLRLTHAGLAFYARCGRLVREVGRGRPRRFSLAAIPLLFRILVGMGLLSPRRFLFWRLFFKAMRRPHAFARAMSIAVQGEHLIRYTREDVLPRIDRALAELAAERVRQAPAAEARA